MNGRPVRDCSPDSTSVNIDDRREIIETARARGLTAEQTAERYGLRLIDVLATWARQDALNCETDQPAKKPYRRHRTHKQPRPLKPCGTPGAAARHRKRGERLDAACAEAERRYGREKYARRKAA